MLKSRTSRIPVAPGARFMIAAVSSLTGAARLFLWRLRYRHELSALAPEQMRDVGLDPEAVRRESRKPFWVP
jgi:uncharacterized protein YjiS (DUF1127 family)